MKNVHIISHSHWDRALKNAEKYASGDELLSFSGKGLKHTAVKHKMGGNDIITSWTNYTDKEQVLTVAKTEFINNLYRSNVAEEKLETLKDDGEKWHITVKPYEILTLGTEKC